MLASRDTFVLAASMHIAFLGGDIIIKKPLDRIRHNLLLVQQIQKSPQALKVAQEYSKKKGLSFLQELLANTSKVNKIRSHLTKVKIKVHYFQVKELLMQLRLSSLVDEQIQHAKKLSKLDYQLELYNRFFKLKSTKEKRNFVDELLNSQNDDFKLNFAFVMNLFNSVYQNKVVPKEFQQDYNNYIDGTKDEIPDHTGLNITAGLRAINRRTTR